MRKKIYLVLVAVSMSVLACAFSVSVSFAQITQVGVAGVVAGAGEAVSEDGGTRELQSGDPIYLGDRVNTGSEGHLQILFNDETVFTLAPSSSILIDEFLYDPQTGEGKLETKITKGVFRFISGKIAHKKPENMSVELPAGTIGIRGTIVAGTVEDLRSMVVLLGPAGDEGTRPGSIFVSNLVDGKPEGVLIDQKGYATIIEGLNTAPAPVFKVTEGEIIRIASLLNGASPKKSEHISSGGEGSAGPSDLNAGHMSQTLSIMSQMEEYSQKAAQGGMMMPAPQVVQPVAAVGRGDDDD